ncbi:DUF397 domain-containing protein [Streptomyces mirabilis]|uniref:DUF397 domain-containing protein n=1 Tax=Streptomyces mirabilis TaxID=68239 RepID=UPI00342DD664
MARTETDLSSALWRKSSYSNGSGGDCVEVVVGLSDVVPVRDSKLQEGPVLLIPPTAWTTFIATLPR